jgi:hypothetical protein
MDDGVMADGVGVGDAVGVGVSVGVGVAVGLGVGVGVGVISDGVRVDGDCDGDGEGLGLCWTDVAEEKLKTIRHKASTNAHDIYRRIGTTPDFSAFMCGFDSCLSGGVVHGGAKLRLCVRN